MDNRGRIRLVEQARFGEGYLVLREGRIERRPFTVLRRAENGDYIVREPEDEVRSELCPEED